MNRQNVMQQIIQFFFAAYSCTLLRMSITGYRRASTLGHHKAALHIGIPVHGTGKVLFYRAMLCNTESIEFVGTFIVILKNA